MPYHIEYTEKALEDLSCLEKDIARRIRNKIDFFSAQVNPFRFAKKLKDPEAGTYRFRIGDYRAIFDVDHKGNVSILHILRIKHRKEIYQLEK